MGTKKTWDFTEDSKEEFRESKVSGLESVPRLPRVLSTLQEVGNSSYFGLFSIFGLEMVRCLSSYRASFA